jgi:hypothetical protein
VASNVSIIDFEEIENRICKQLEYLYKPMSETYDGDTTKEVVNINVNEISLGAALLGLKDNNKEAYLVPVWYVPYTVKDSIFYDDQSGKIVQEDFIYDDALVFNAIDGSVVEPRVAL